MSPDGQEFLVPIVTLSEKSEIVVMQNWQAGQAEPSDLEMTGEYTFVTPERQNELTRRIQQKLGEAANKRNGATPGPPSTGETLPLLSERGVAVHCDCCNDLKASSQQV